MSKPVNSPATWAHHHGTVARRPARHACATAFGQIRLNAWNQPFYNALERRDLHGFFVQLVIFCIIAGALLLLNVAQAWLNQATKVKLREGPVRDLFDQWLRARRAFRLAYAGEIGANPDQRIHEDARHLTI